MMDEKQLQNLIDRNNSKYFSIQTMDLNKIKKAINLHKNNPDKNNLQKIEYLFEEILKSIEKLKKELEFQNDIRECLVESLKNSEDELFSLSIETQIKINEKLTDNLNKMIEVEEMKKGILRGAIETHSMIVAINMTKKIVKEEKEYKNKDNFFVKNKENISVLYFIINIIATIIFSITMPIFVNENVLPPYLGFLSVSLFSFMSFIIFLKIFKKCFDFVGTFAIFKDFGGLVFGYLIHLIPIFGIIANFAISMMAITEIMENDVKEDDGIYY